MMIRTRCELPNLAALALVTLSYLAWRNAAPRPCPGLRVGALTACAAILADACRGSLAPIVGDWLVVAWPALIAAFLWFEIARDRTATRLALAVVIRR